MVMRPAWRAFSLHFLAILVFAGGPVLNPQALLSAQTGQIIAAILFLFILFKRFATYYELTAQHLTIKNMGEEEIVLEYQDIAQARLSQGAIKKKLGYGNLNVYCRESPDKPHVMYGIVLPDKVRQYILHNEK